VRGTGHVAGMGDRRNVYSIVVEPEGWIPLGISSCVWEDNNKMNLQEIVSESLHCIHLAQNRVQWQAFVYTVMNLRFL
jgi:hypothetical protein